MIRFSKATGKNPAPCLQAWGLPSPPRRPVCQDGCRRTGHGEFPRHPIRKRRSQWHSASFGRRMELISSCLILLFPQPAPVGAWRIPMPRSRRSSISRPNLGPSARRTWSSSIPRWLRPWD